MYCEHKMKILTFGALMLLSTTEIYADLSNQPHKIQTLVKKLFNLNPDPIVVRNLGNSLKLEIDEVQTDMESREFIDVIYKFGNVTVSKIYDYPKKLSSQFVSVICDFHHRLTITQSIDPLDLEIRGIYKIGNSSENSTPNEFFIVKQYEGRIVYQLTWDGVNNTDLVYKNQEIKFGESSKNHAKVIRAIGTIVEEVNNRTANKANQTRNLPNKIKNFEHVFPFLLDSLSPLNKTALKAQDENTYSINNPIIERWENMNWTLPYIMIRGLNNLKQAKITAFDNGTGVRFNITLITDKLKGYFEWRYGKVYHIVTTNRTENFTINNLTLTANTRYENDWIIDKLEIELGSISIQKLNINESSPNINDFVYDILHENLETLIKTHLKQLIQEEYSNPTKTIKLKSITSTTDYKSAKNSSTTDLWNLRNIPDKRLLVDLFNRTTNTMQITTSTTGQPNQTTLCKDGRRWWQKIYRRNKCKGEKKPVSVEQIPATNKCVDNRWWFQKPFVRNKCAKNFSTTSAVEQKIAENENDSNLQALATEKCMDTRWWFQKPFIRNKCKPEREILLEKGN